MKGEKMKDIKKLVESEVQLGINFWSFDLNGRRIRRFTKADKKQFVQEIMSKLTGTETKEKIRDIGVRFFSNIVTEGKYDR